MRPIITPMDPKVKAPKKTYLPDDDMDRAQADILVSRGRFKGWKVIPFGSKFQLQAPNDHVFLRKYSDTKGTFYHACVSAFNADEDPNKAMDELLQWMKKQKL